MPEPRRALAAQRANFEAFYRRHYDAVMSFVLRRADAGVAEDIVAETFLTAWRRVNDLPSEPLPWLYVTARHVLANERRGGLRREALKAKLNGQRVNVAPASDGDPAALADRAQLAASFNRLSRSDREVLSLIAWEKLSPDDAATALGCSPGTFTVRLHRARRRLSQLLVTLDSEADEVEVTQS